MSAKDASSRHVPESRRAVLEGPPEIRWKSDCSLGIEGPKVRGCLFVTLDADEHTDVTAASALGACNRPPVSLCIAFWWRFRPTGRRERIRGLRADERQTTQRRSDDRNVYQPSWSHEGECQASSILQTCATVTWQAVRTILVHIFT